MERSWRRRRGGGGRKSNKVDGGGNRRRGPQRCISTHRGRRTGARRGGKSDKKSMLGASTTFFQMLAVQLSVGCQPCLPPSSSSTFFSDPNTVSGLREGPSHCVPDRDFPPSSPVQSMLSRAHLSTPLLLWCGQSTFFLAQIILVMKQKRRE